MDMTTTSWLISCIFKKGGKMQIFLKLKLFRKKQNQILNQRPLGRNKLKARGYTYFKGLSTVCKGF